MRKLILLFFFVSSALWLHAKDFTRYVSPLVGTQSTFELSTGIPILRSHVPGV